MGLNESTIVRGETYKIALMGFIIVVLLQLTALIECQISCERDVCFQSSRRVCQSCCADHSSQCTWYSYASPTTEVTQFADSSGRVLNFSSFGQYVCNQTQSNQTERTVLFLPDSQEESCQLCMKVEACRSNTEIVLTITPLIDRSLLMSINRCELKINGVTCIPLTSTNLSIHTESVANKSVAITCPICDDEHNIYHVIPTSTLTDSENCAAAAPIPTRVESCGPLPITVHTATTSTSRTPTTLLGPTIQTPQKTSVYTAVNSTAVSPSTTALPKTNSETVLTDSVTRTTMTTSSISSAFLTVTGSSTTTTLVPTSSNSSDNGTNGDNTNVGAIVGGVVGGVVAMITVCVVVVLIYCCCCRSTKSDQNSKSDNGTNDDNTNVGAIVGAIVGGVVVVAGMIIVPLLICYFCCRSTKSDQKSTSEDDGDPDHL
ncbi:uncharacterized protein [Dysidea avara]|uniref:uncharacterized protein isoform X2 n=1 Tax=Dysidea avara TaxID=196820 RepID=UPI0033302FD8